MYAFAKCIPCSLRFVAASDYTLAQWGRSELQTLQTGFVDSVLSTLSLSKTDPTSQVIRSFAVESLHYHVAAGVTFPLRSDSTAREWLLYEDDVDYEVVVQGILRGIGDLSEVTR